MSKHRLPIYSAEIADGLAQSLSVAAISYISPVVSATATLNDRLVAIAAKQLSVGETDDSIDLYPIHSILVTTGWNKNDDIFLPVETWAARFTPEDKPFNLGHNPRQIIGHITNNFAVNDDLEFLDSDLPVDQLPEKFHLLTSAVVYRHLASKDPKLEEEAAELIRGIQNGDWFVSMEALFCDFDYGIQYSTGEQQLVRRDASTAFLTKHLRAHGGSGEYNGGHLGRVLRNLVYSGKGLVANPANPESVIFNDVKMFSGHAVTNTNISHGEQTMADDKYTNQLETQVKSLQAELATANKRVEELGDATVKATVAEKESLIEKLRAEIDEVKAKLEESTANYNDAVKARDEAQAAKETAEKQLTEAQKKIEETEAKAKATARTSLLIDKGVDKAEAEKLVAEFDELSDEKFAKIVAMAVKQIEAEGEEETEPETDPEGEAAAKDTDVETVETETTEAGAIDEEDGQAEILNALAGYLEEVLHGPSTEDDDTN